MVAVRSNEAGDHKLTYLAGDHHGTSGLAITADYSQTVTKRYMTPFGASRGDSSSGDWPDDKAFLGKAADAATGLTHIGAREYDPLIGQFISVDPLLEPAKHQSLNGYTYAENNPATLADPSGMNSFRCSDDCSAQVRFVEEHSPPRVWAGETWESKYPNYPRGTAGICLLNCKPLPSPNKYPLIPPAPGPEPAPEPFIYKLGGFMASVLLPDFEAWSGCFNEPGFTADCGSTALDLPWFKPIKAADRVVDAAKAVDKAHDAEKRVDDAPSCKCFLAGTDVLMADGQTKNIEEIELGDKVQATDPETGESGNREVTRLIVTEDDKYFNELSIATEEGIGKLTATHEHPFWSPSERRWVEARKLGTGMTLLTDDGDIAIVTANRAFSQHARTYNLTVDGLHTYYALAGATPVLVHNSGGCIPALRDWSSQRFQFGNETFLLDKKGMEHILTRHHPKMWDGSVKAQQSFFDPKMSVADVQDAIGQVMRQNRDTLIQRGTRGMYQVRGNVNGVDYVLGMNRGRVGQFYPGSP